MLRAFLVVVTSVTWSAWGRAHVEVQNGERPFVVDGEVIGGETTWGVISPEGGVARRVCDESFPGVAAFAHRRVDGSMLLGGADGLYETNEAGCTFTKPTTALGERNATGIAVSGDVVLVATSEAAVPNALYRSDDEGRSFSEVFPPEEGLLLFHVAFNNAGDRAIVTGARVPPDSPAVPVLLRSDDGGASFVDVSSALTLPFARALGFDIDDQGALISGFDVDGIGVLQRLPHDSTVVEDLGTFPTEVTHALAFEGSRYALAKRASLLFRQENGTGEFVAITDGRSGPTDCIFVADDGQSLIGCGRAGFFSIELFAQSFDGGFTWATVMTSQIPYRICPESTDGYTFCTTFFEARCSDGEDDDFDGDIDCEDFDCPGPCVSEGEGEVSVELDAGPDNAPVNRELSIGGGAASCASTPASLWTLWTAALAAVAASGFRRRRRQRLHRNHSRAPFSL